MTRIRQLQQSYITQPTSQSGGVCNVALHMPVSGWPTDTSKAGVCDLTLGSVLEPVRAWWCSVCLRVCGQGSYNQTMKLNPQSEGSGW